MGKDLSFISRIQCSLDAFSLAQYIANTVLMMLFVEMGEKEVTEAGTLYVGGRKSGFIKTLFIQMFYMPHPIFHSSRLFVYSLALSSPWHIAVRIRDVT